jgi:hypothetical protein
MRQDLHRGRSFEQLVAEGVLYRLDTPELAAALAGEAAADERTATLSDEVAAAQAKLDELADLYSTDQISAREWVRARKPIEARHEQAKPPGSAQPQPRPRPLRRDRQPAPSRLVRSEPGPAACHRRRSP